MKNKSLLTHEVNSQDKRLPYGKNNGIRPGVYTEEGLEILHDFSSNRWTIFILPLLTPYSTPSHRY